MYIQVAILVTILLHLGDAEQELIRNKRAASVYVAPDQKKFVDEHNKYRKGEGAMNMNKVSWDAKLAESAQIWANKCKWGHTIEKVTGGNYNPGNTGQNVYIHATVKDQATVVKAWFDEKNYYDYATNVCKTGKICGHYTGMVWGPTRHIGCGFTKCANFVGGSGKKYPVAQHVVCNYGPGGNIMDAKTKKIILPFKKGKACARCGSGAGWCTTDGLCDSTCKAASASCVCKMLCARESPTDPKTCKCKCRDGYKGLFCLEECKDLNPTHCENVSDKTECDGKVVGVKAGNANKLACPAKCELCKGLTAKNKFEDKTDLGGGSTSGNTNTGGDKTKTTAKPKTDDKKPKPTEKPKSDKDKTDSKNSANTDPISETSAGIKMEMKAGISEFPKIWSGMQIAVADSLNKYCNGEPVACCKGVKHDRTSGNKYVTVPDVKKGKRYPLNIGSGYLEVLLFVLSEKESGVCKKLRGSRKKRSTDSNAMNIPKDVLLKAVKDDLAEINKKLKKCCGVTVEKVKAAEASPMGQRPAGLEGWEIALIVITVLAIIAVACIITYIVYKQHIQNKSDKKGFNRQEEKKVEGMDNPQTTEM